MNNVVKFADIFRAIEEEGKKEKRHQVGTKTNTRNGMYK